MRAGDVDISLGGHGSTMLEDFFTKNKGNGYVKLMTNDGFVSNKYMLGDTIMEYIRKYMSSENPKIVTVTVCEKGNDSIEFDTEKFKEEYRSRPPTKRGSS